MTTFDLSPNRLWRDAPTFTGLALFIALTAIPLLAAATLDPREFLNAPIWQKPLQFHLALATFIITLAFFARFLPNGMTSRRWRVYSGIVTFCILAELVWVGGAAAFGTASHFNIDDAVMGTLYGLMGVFAVILTSPSLAMGIAIWRNPNTGLSPALQLSIALGLILTFLLTLIAAGTMSSMPGHLIGTPITHASVPILGWSREAGDLRVAHFFATHALHALPLIGLAAAHFLPTTTARATVWLSAAAYCALVAFAMVQAFQGQPFL
jgi:heme/copper-type cytochrome/quinol oxidase subunit 4